MSFNPKLQMRFLSVKYDFPEIRKLRNTEVHLLRTYNQWSSLDGCCFSPRPSAPAEAGGAPATASSREPPRPIFLSPRLPLGLSAPAGSPFHSVVCSEDLYSAGPGSPTLLFCVEADFTQGHVRTPPAPRGVAWILPSSTQCPRGLGPPHPPRASADPTHAGLGNAVGSRSYFLPESGAGE